MAIISGHNRYVACCAFSRDGNLLATGNIPLHFRKIYDLFHGNWYLI